MDIKDVLLQNENSIPSLTENLSTGTAASPGLTATVAPSTFWKFGASSVMGLAGMLYLGMGKKQNDVQKMIIGAVLTLASFFVF